jgi:hypothetical protein
MFLDLFVEDLQVILATVMLGRRNPVCPSYEVPVPSPFTPISEAAFVT